MIGFEYFICKNCGKTIAVGGPAAPESLLCAECECAKVAILYITFNRLEYTMQTLPALLEMNNAAHFDVYIFDNGSTDGTVEYLKEFESHKRVAQITYLEENIGIAPVQNKFWHKTAWVYPYVGKIDNDIVVPAFWIDMCIDRIGSIENAGVISLWHWHPGLINYIEKDFMIVLGDRYNMAHTSHVGGNYLMSSELFKRFGEVKEGTSLKGGFTMWQWELNKSLIKHGFVYPFATFGHLPVLEQEEIPDKDLAEAKKILEVKNVLQVVYIR